MRKLAIYLLLFACGLSYAQISANRFFYELNYKPKKDSSKVDKVMMSLDIVDGKSIFRDFTTLAQDSLLKAKIDEMVKTMNVRDISKEIKKPKFSFIITKTYPEMLVRYSEDIISGMYPIRLAYHETPRFDWKILPEKQKIRRIQYSKSSNLIWRKNLDSMV